MVVLYVIQLTRICHHQYDILANSDVITIMIIVRDTADENMSPSI